MKEQKLPSRWEPLLISRGPLFAAPATQKYVPVHEVLLLPRKSGSRSTSGAHARTGNLENQSEAPAILRLVSPPQNGGHRQFGHYREDIVYTSEYTTVDNLRVWELRLHLCQALS